MSYENTSAQRNPHTDSFDLSHRVEYKLSISCPERRHPERCRELVIQACDVEEVDILKGVVSNDHVHIHIKYSPRSSISQLVKRIKGRTSRMLQKEFPKLKKRYGDRHFWATEYGAWSTRNIPDEMVQAYMEHHRSKTDDDNSDFILE